MKAAICLLLLATPWNPNALSLECGLAGLICGACWILDEVSNGEPTLSAKVAGEKVTGPRD